MRAPAYTVYDPRRGLLVLRLILANALAALLLFFAWTLPIDLIDGASAIEYLLAHDSLYLCRAIAAVFAFGWLWNVARAVQTSLDLDEARRGCTPLGLYGPAESVRLKLANRVASVRHIANSLVLLGLIGTVIGFIIALSGVDQEAIGDVSAVGPMVSTLIQGMGIALHTTLVGSLLHLWLNMNVRLLEGGTVKLYTAVLDLADGWSGGRDV